MSTLLVSFRWILISTLNGANRKFISSAKYQEQLPGKLYVGEKTKIDNMKCFLKWYSFLRIPKVN